MSEGYNLCDTKLDSPLQVRLCRIKEKVVFFRNQ